VTIKGVAIATLGFHSISFPSEWGLDVATTAKLYGVVSIQLVSPASGDCWGEMGRLLPDGSFHSISFPSEWGQYLLLLQRQLS